MSQKKRVPGLRHQVQTFVCVCVCWDGAMCRGAIAVIADPLGLIIAGLPLGLKALIGCTNMATRAIGDSFSQKVVMRSRSSCSLERDAFWRILRIAVHTPELWTPFYRAGNLFPRFWLAAEIKPRRRHLQTTIWISWHAMEPEPRRTVHPTLPSHTSVSPKVVSAETMPP